MTFEGMVLTILLLSFLLTASALKITTCNCSMVQVKGIIDLEEPKYCKDPSPIQTYKMVPYSVYAHSEQTESWEAVSCSQWYSELQVTKFFFGGTDSIYRKTMRKVAPGECWDSARYPHNCGSNHMETDGDSYKFLQEAKGDPYWMYTTNYTILNCVTKPIKIYQKCSSCPLITPFGEVNTTSDWAVINGITMVWHRNLNKTAKCDYEEIVTGTGHLTTINSAGRLIDDQGQLEFLFNPTNITDFCNTKQLKHYQVHAVLGVDNTFISFNNDSKLERKKRQTAVETDLQPAFPRGMIRSYARSFNCLSYIKKKLILVPCPVFGTWQNQEEREIRTLLSGQSFTYDNDGVISLTNSSLCLESVSGAPALIHCSFTYRSKWNPIPLNRTVGGRSVYIY